MKKYNAPRYMIKFIEILIERLDTPLMEIFKLLNISSGYDYYNFFNEIEDFGPKNSTKGEDCAEIILIANLFISRVVDEVKIEDVWIGRIGIVAPDNLELLEHDDGMYWIYRLNLHGKNYIGQSVIPLQHRSSQHIAKFKVAP